jgi:hypothetical protein
MGKLIAEWNTRLEIDTRDNDYQQQRIRAQELQQARTPTALVPASRPEVASIFTWKELENRFQKFQTKATGQKFSADFIRTDWESGDVSEEWFVGGNPACRKEFEHLASISARKLGCTRTEGANEYWLDRVWEWMQQAGLDKDKNVAWLSTGTVVQAGLTGTTQGLFTEKIAELSAMFCVELIARGTPESAISPPSTGNDSQQGIAPATVNRPTRSTGRTKVLTATEKKRRKVIFGAIQANDKGLKYCKTLDERNLAIPAEWRQGGCPKTYTDAYKAGQPWQKRIQDEKSRYKKKYDETPAAEREKLLQ